MLGPFNSFYVFHFFFGRDASLDTQFFLFLALLEYLGLPSLLVVQGRRQGPESTIMGKVTWLEVNCV